MLGNMLEGLLRLMLRVWTIGLFYFLNNRFLLWLKESRTPKIPYQKILTSIEEETFAKPHNKKNSELKSTSWKNLIFINMLNSKNFGLHYGQRTALFLPDRNKQSYCDKDTIEDNYSKSNLVISWDLPCAQSSKDFGKGMQEFYDTRFSKNSVPHQCFSRNFLEPTIYEDTLFENFMEKEREKQDKMRFTMEQERFISRKMDSAIYEGYFSGLNETKNLLQMDNFSKKSFPSKEIHCSLDNIICNSDLCMEKERKTASENTGICFWPEDICSSFENDMCESYVGHSLEPKEVEKHNNMDSLAQVERLYPKEPHCSSAASIDSGFQSFCSINMTYTCLDICGVTLFISNISHNKEGKIIAMNVGFSAAEDSSEESIFSDDDESDSESENICDEEDDFKYCCDSDDDFIVFDTKQIPMSEQFCRSDLEEITVEVNLNTPCQTFDFKISQTLSPNANYFCHVNVDERERKTHTKIDREFDFKTDFQIGETGTQNVDKSDSAGTVTTRKVQFSDDVEVHKFVTWEYAYRKARLGPWKDLAADRLHFKRRIEEVRKVVEPVLKNKIAMIA